MTEWSEKFADVILEKVNPERSFRRWKRLGMARGIRGWLRTLNPRETYIAGFDVGVRASLAILDEVRAFERAREKLAAGGTAKPCVCHYCKARAASIPQGAKSSV